jgi:hypothetical protein
LRPSELARGLTETRRLVHLRSMSHFVPSPALLGKVVRSAGWDMARRHGRGALHERNRKPSSTPGCFPHPIRRSAPPSPLRGEGRVAAAELEAGSVTPTLTRVAAFLVEIGAPIAIGETQA